MNKSIEPRQFLDATRKGNLKTVQQYLNQANANIECRGYLNMTALLLASNDGFTEIVKILLKSGADVNNTWYPETKSGTALEMAADKGYVDIANLLFDSGSKVNNPLTGQSLALIGAARGGHLSILNRLIDEGANCHSVTGDKTTILILISGFGPNHVLNPDFELLKKIMIKLMDAGLDVNTVDNLNNNPLTCAIKADNEPIVKFLLDSGADPNLSASLLIPEQIVRYNRCLDLLINAGLSNDFFLKAISTALLNGQHDSAMSLAKALPKSISKLHICGIKFIKGCMTDDLTAFSKCIKDHKDKDSFTVYSGIALSMIIEWVRKRLEKAKILITAGAKVNENLGYYTSIIKACKTQNIELIQLLINHGADPNLGTNKSITPLMIAYGGDRLFDDRSFPAKNFNKNADHLAKLLINAGANVNTKTSEGLTPLIIAAQKFPFNLERLIKAGADVNAKTKQGATALMSTNPKNTKLLIDAGADVNITDKAGRTALFLSTIPAKANILKKAGADPTIRDHNGMTPLMYHGQKSNMKMIKWFAKYKKNRGALDNKGNNAILYVYGNNYKEIIEYLVDRKEDPNIVNQQGDTFLIISCRSGNLDLIKLALSFNPNIDAINKSGETALMISCRYHDDGSAAKMLIKHGANPFIKGSNGLTALEIATQFKSKEAVESIENLLELKKRTN